MKGKMSYATVRSANADRAFRAPVWLCAVIVSLVCALPAAGQNVPIQITVTNAIVDQWGTPLVHKNGGDLVQVLFVNGQVYPPNMDGSPNSNNTISAICRIGNGVIERPWTLGKFNAALTERSEAQIFVRVWNTPSLANASYYTDSQIFTPQQGKIFYPDFGPMIPLDPDDDDNDGLNNSDENDLGSNKNNADTDGDGVFDFAEFRAGTELTNDLSYLAMKEMVPDDVYVDVVDLQWSSVAGKSYQVQYTTQQLDDPDVVFTDVNGVITATGDISYTTVTNYFHEAIKAFRVRLVE